MKTAQDYLEQVKEIIEKEGNDCHSRIEVDTPLKAIIKSTIKGSISLIEINDIVAIGATHMDIKRSGAGLSILTTILKS